MEVTHFQVRDLGQVEGAAKLEVFLRFPLKVSDFDYRLAFDSVRCSDCTRISAPAGGVR